MVKVERIDTVVVGAGLAGMATAVHLPGETLVLEAEGRAGGLAVTDFVDGYGFDITGHWLHMRDPEVLARFGQLAPMAKVTRKSKILAHERLIAYPFQSNLKDLPLSVRTECLAGAMEAHARRAAGGSEPERFSDYVRHHFGEGIANEFMFPYNRKLWGVEPEDISHAWCQRFVPVPDLKQILEGALTDANERAGYNASFSYPVSGGIGAFASAMAGLVPNIRLSTRVVRVHAEERWLETENGNRLSFTNLVSTMPLKTLVKLLVDAPEDVRIAADRLKCTSVDYYDLGVDREVLSGLHWLYLPHPDLPPYRLGCYSNAVPSMAPSGCSSLYVELANDRAVDHDTVLDAVMEVLSATGTEVDRSNAKVWRRRRIPFAYVIYDHNYQAARQQIMSFVRNKEIQSTGRYGKWVYSSMEDALIDGREAAGRIGNIGNG